MGSGKTTLTKGIISGLGAAREEDVTSPTFTLVHVSPEPRPGLPVDLYRIEGLRDLETLGLEDAFVRTGHGDHRVGGAVFAAQRLAAGGHQLEHLEKDRRRISIDPS